jgi:septal ring factor EnvC (AmiA/AmiB activator)
MNDSHEPVSNRQKAPIYDLREMGVPLAAVGAIVVSILAAWFFIVGGIDKRIDDHGRHLHADAVSKEALKDHIDNYNRHLENMRAQIKALQEQDRKNSERIKRLETIHEFDLGKMEK